MLHCTTDLISVTFVCCGRVVTTGAGYTYPWSLPDPKAYFKRVESLNQKYMPADVWEDVWDGGCPEVRGIPVAAVGQNPCLPMCVVRSAVWIATITPFQTCLVLLGLLPYDL
jgi:hypothetical protein